MAECKCDIRIRTLGDGCEVCNPAKALEYAKEEIADLEKRNEALCDALKQIEAGDKFAPDMQEIARKALVVDYWATC